ncbi:MAG: sialidase family protein, partial [Bythopirellula sp.]
PGLIRAEFIYESAPFPSCHASTILQTTDGLVAAWFGGTHERHTDVGIWLSHHRGDGWSEPVEVANGVVADGERYPTWNPVLFQPRSGSLMLFYKVGPTPRDWWGMVMTSQDGGQTWSEPQRLPDGILGPIKNKPVQLASGVLLAPSSSEHDGWRVHIERSTEGGKTWQATPPLNDGQSISAIQPSILIHDDGQLQALGRTRSSSLFQIWSQDSGKTWSEMRLTSLPNPSAGTDAVTLADGRHLLVYNHSDSERSPLNVAISADGHIWQAALVLENNPGKEFSYPAVIQASDGLVHITYTWHRKRIRHVVIDLGKLLLQPMVDGKWPTLPTGSQ